MYVHPHKIRRLINVHELAAKRGRSVSSTWSDVAAGLLPKGLKIKGSTRWVEDEIDADFDRLIAERDGAA